MVKKKKRLKKCQIFAKTQRMQVTWNYIYTYENIHSFNTRNAAKTAG